MQTKTPVYHDNSREAFLMRLLPDKYKRAEGFCKKHGRYQTVVDTSSGEKGMCPVCWKEQEEAEKKKKQEHEKLTKIFNSIDGLPEKYRNAGFKNFELTEKKTAAFNRVLKFAKEPRNTWLLLLGENGTGKTHLAHAVLKMTGGIFREFDDIAIDMQDAQKRSGEGMKKVISKYAAAPMLVIDEVDKVNPTAGRINWLNIILRKRYNDMLPLVLCGNIDLETLCSRIDQSGKHALKDRIDEVGEVVLCNWESYRPNLREAAAIKNERNW